MSSSISSQRGATYRVKVAFLVDVTGSMARSIAAVHDLISNVVNVGRDTFKGIEPLFAFVGYRDVTDGDRQYVKCDFKSEAELGDFISVVDDIEASGGADVPENVLGGMETALTELNWGTDARVKILIHIADAPHHGAAYCPAGISDSHPELQDSPRHAEDILRDYAQKKIDYYFFQVKEPSGRLITDQMVAKFAEYYNAAQARTRNFTPYTLEKDFAISTMFERIMGSLSASVLNFLKADKTGTLTVPSTSDVISKVTAAKEKVEDDGIAGMLADFTSATSITSSGTKSAAITGASKLKISSSIPTATAATTTSHPAIPTSTPVISASTAAKSKLSIKL